MAARLSRFIGNALGGARLPEVVRGRPLSAVKYFASQPPQKLETEGISLQMKDLLDGSKVVSKGNENGREIFEWTDGGRFYIKSNTFVYTEYPPQVDKTLFLHHHLNAKDLMSQKAMEEYEEKQQRIIDAKIHSGENPGG